MSRSYDVLSVGVEEEYQLVDPVTGLLRPKCKQVMHNLREQTDAEIQHELHLNQIEMASSVCSTLDEVRSGLQRVRRLLVESATKSDASLAAAGTHPLEVPDDPVMTDKARYRRMTERYQQIAKELLIFGCHVHVAMENRELGLQVMDHSRRWLPLMQALTANSPYWDGHDTGYASYRRELWVQWPMAGPPPRFRDFADYHDCVEDLVAVGAIADESFIYWDIRLPTKVPTIEFRGADVMTKISQTVGYVGLIRALVMQCKADISAGRNYPPIRSSVLSYAMWHAARYGTANDLVDPGSCEKLPVADNAERLLQYIQPALEATGDGELVTAFVRDAVHHGPGAVAQRAAADGNDLRPVVRYVVEQTAAELATTQQES